MKKAIVTTRVNNYFPELCEYTIPNLKRYADKIGADFIQTTERLSPEVHPAYEKLQVYKVAPYYDRTILIDADIMLHPQIPDFTQLYGPTEVGIWMQYPIQTPDLTLWNPNESRFFFKDGRNFGVVGALVGCSNLTCDIFDPLPPNEAAEKQNRLYRPAIIDEYIMSLNLAKYSYKVVPLWNEIGIFHAEMTTKNPEDILTKVRQIDQEWR